MTPNSPSDVNETLQQHEVEGTITDGTGMPLVGVTVIIEGTQKGTVTNYDGKYKITLEADNQVLVFSSLGYQTERITVGGQNVINHSHERRFQPTGRSSFDWLWRTKA
ncbi:MAG: carboxypeptidase-like regulatory domain-containing protein [Gelidibacter sp.]